MIGVISIFVLPKEVEDLSLTLYNLKRNSIFLNKQVDYVIDITLCLSNELTDWNSSKLPKEYLEDKVRHACSIYLDWCTYNLFVEHGKDILGCVSQRRMSYKNHQDADFFIWLDPDIYFQESTLHYFEKVYSLYKGRDVVVTPQYIKMWDNSWDVLVNEEFINKGHDFYLNNDVFLSCSFLKGNAKIRELHMFKFGGGLFTMISKTLLDKTLIPESFGHYGLEDTYIMSCATILKMNMKDVHQILIENLVAAELYKQRNDKAISKYISDINRKKEYRQISEKNFNKEVELFIRRNNIT